MVLKVDSPEKEIRSMFDDIEKQEQSLSMIRMKLDSGKKLTATRFGMVYVVDQEVFEQCQADWKKATDKMWSDYEKLRELGVVKIIQAHE